MSLQAYRVIQKHHIFMCQEGWMHLWALPPKKEFLQQNLWTAVVTVKPEAYVTVEPETEDYRMLDSGCSCSSDCV